MSERLILRPPSAVNQVLEKLHLREVKPADICLNPQDLGRLYSTYPDLAGDKEIGFGNDSHCQSWQGVPGWWRNMIDLKMGENLKGR